MVSKIITLTLTQSCNLSCVYCYEANKSHSKMPVNMAKRIVDKEIQSANKGDTVEIDFFGGEPMLEFPTIKEIVSYVRTSYTEVNVIFFIITNGTILTDEIKNWLVANSDCVICGLSFDGTKAMQNINRSNSYDMIDLDFFATQYPGQTVKMTVSTYTLGNLAEGVIFLQEKGFEVACNLAYGINWADESYCKILEDELLKLISYYLNNPQKKVCSMLDMGIEKIALTDGKKERYCGAGISMISYDVDGESYPCQLFMPLSVGREKADKSKSIHFYEDIIPDNLLAEDCRSCVIKALCPLCYGSNYIATGSIYSHDTSSCKLMKIIMKARSYLKGLMWQKGMLDLSDEREALLLKSIHILQNAIE